MLKNLSKGLILRYKSLDRNLEIICDGQPRGLTIYQVSAWSDVGGFIRKRKSLQTDGRTDGRPGE